MDSLLNHVADDEKQKYYSKAKIVYIVEPF